MASANIALVVTFGLVKAWNDLLSKPTSVFYHFRLLNPKTGRITSFHRATHIHTLSLTFYMEQLKQMYGNVCNFWGTTKTRALETEILTASLLNDTQGKVTC